MDKAKKFLFIAGLLFIFTAILFSYEGLMLYRAYDFSQHAQPVQAEITGLYEDHVPFLMTTEGMKKWQTVYKLKYQVGGNEYTTEEASPDMPAKIGSKVNILYDTRHHEIAHSPGAVWWNAKRMGLVISPYAFFFFPALILIPYLMMRGGKKKRLLQYGIPVTATVKKVYQLEQMQQMGINSYIAEAEYNDGIETYNYKAFIDSKLADNIKELPFLIDPHNPKFYTLDTDRMAQLTKF